MTSFIMYRFWRMAKRRRQFAILGLMPIDLLDSIASRQVGIAYPTFSVYVLNLSAHLLHILINIIDHARQLRFCRQADALVTECNEDFSRKGTRPDIRVAENF